MQQLSRQERLDWLQLIRTRNVGPATFSDLIGHFGNAADALAALPDFARRGGGKGGFKLASRKDAERELDRLDALGAQLIASCEASYPRQLANCEAPPPLISLKGHSHLLHQPCVAVVGARNASLAGTQIAGQLAQEIGARQFTIISGLARGIDTAAHQSALASGTGAVLAGGIDIVYPQQNRKLYDAIAERGVLVSEMPPGTEPQARQFPRRNRLISGLSAGVVIVEAALRSGSLITARFAAEQGREVFVVPGSPLDPRSRGGNGLIRQGATLVETADDVLEGLRHVGQAPLGEPPDTQPMHPPARQLDASALDRERPRILALLSPTPVAVDLLIRETGLPTALVSAILLELDIAGRLERHAGQRVSLIA